MIRIILGVMAAFVLGSGISFGNTPLEPDDLIQEARQGDTRAMCDLAILYYQGKGVLKDPFKAKCWVKKAYDLGSPRAEKIWNELKLWQYSGKCHLEFDDRPMPEHRAEDLYQEPVTGMAFVWIPGKCFKMGCGENRKDCPKKLPPARKICLDGFWMGQYEVSQEEWMALMEVNPSRFRGDRLPVEQVSFQEVREFIHRLNQETGREFALPTEAQWEFACRNRGKGITYPWGREDFQPQSNCGGCDAGSYRGRTAPVGSFSPNGAGLYDMGGNVREWTRDRYDRDTYARGRGKNGPRVVRGGSFVDPVSSSQCRVRQGVLPDMKTYFTGFRLTLKPKK